MRKVRLLLDANVLADAQVRDFFCRFAETDLIAVHWTSTILAETGRALRKIGLDESAIERVLAALATAFPGALINGYEHLIDRVSYPTLMTDTSWRLLCLASATCS